jgi:mannose-1-phosphate guanylyltransferase
MSGNPIKTAFILGAGQGTRLRPLTNTFPKPLLPLGGRPIITYAMEHLLTAGVQRFIVNTHHLADIYGQVFSESKWQGMPIIFRYEPELLDTAGGLKNIEDLLDADEDILIYNGDIISDLPLSGLLAVHALAESEVTIVLRSAGFPLNVTVNENGEICDFRNILGKKGKKYLFTGIYAVRKDFLKRIAPNRKESIIPVFIDIVKEKPGGVAGIIIDEGKWHDVGSLEEYERLNKEFRK